MSTGHFTPGNGRIAADLFDFLKHVNGEGFKHKASDITNSPGVGGATDVQASINNINTFIASLAGKGTAFLSIPDGYNCYTNPAPNFYFDHTVPSLDTFLKPLFTAIIAGSAIPSGYSKLKDGGILYIPAGTYYVSDTVIVPAGITLLGEGYGTKIVNATSLNTALSPPTVNVALPKKPIFKVAVDTTRTVNDAAVDAENSFMFSRATKLIGLTIADNFVEPTLLGDVYYQLPQNNLGDAPLVMQTPGSNLEIYDCKLLGRALTTSEAVSTDGATRFAIKLDTSAPTATGTILKVGSCFIDGFSQPICFPTVGGIMDFLEIQNCKIRSHGYLDNDGSAVASNCIINMNDNNAVITSNYFYGDHDLLTTVVYIADVISAPPFQSISKILVAGNDLAIDVNGVSSITPTIITINPSVASAILSTATILSYGNNFQGNGFTVEGNGGVYFQANASETYLPVAIKFKAVNTSGPTFTVDGTSPDYRIFCDTTNNPITIHLPDHDFGRELIIVDSGYNAAVNNITLVRSVGGNIGDYNGDRVFATNGFSLTLCSDGTNWQIL